MISRRDILDMCRAYKYRLRQCVQPLMFVLLGVALPIWYPRPVCMIVGLVLIILGASIIFFYSLFQFPTRTPGDAGWIPQYSFSWDMDTANAVCQHKGGVESKIQLLDDNKIEYDMKYNENDPVNHVVWSFWSYRHFIKARLYL